MTDCTIAVALGRWSKVSAAGKTSDIFPRQIAFRHEFNHERPHEALQMKVPAELYRPSDRPYPKHLKSFIYPGHYEVRKVSSNGVSAGTPSGSGSARFSAVSTSA